MKEAPNQKVQEKKPLLKFKNTKKNMCLEKFGKNVFGTDPYCTGNRRGKEG